MSTYSNIPLELTVGATKYFTFNLSPAKDLTTADIRLHIKETIDQATTFLLNKQIDIVRSTTLATGSFTFKFIPDDTEGWDAKTYFYEVMIKFNDDEIYYPLVGEMVLYRRI